MNAIERLRELEAQATKPPWRDRTSALMRQWSKADGREYRYVAFSGKADEDYTTSPLNAEDARLIAAMRNALPALLDVAEAARSAVGVCSFWDDGMRPRVAWPVDHEGDSDPETDAPMVALRDALAALDKLS